MKSIERTNSPAEAQSVVFTLPDKREFEGSITRTGLNNYELAIDDLPEEPWAIIERLEAQAKKREDKYLFLNVRFIGSSRHMGRTKDSSTTLFAPTTTFYTNDPDNPLSQNISSLNTNIENLDLWIDESLFSFHSPMHMKDSMDYMLRKEVGNYTFKGFALSLGLAIGGMSFPRLTREVSLTQQAFISLRSKKGDKPYTEYVETLRSLERLIGLAFRSPITSAEIEVTSKDFSLTVGKSKKPNIFPAYPIVLSNVMPSTPTANYSDELAFTHRQIENFQELLNKWAELEKDILPMVDLFLASVSGGSTVLENIFLNRVQAIEGFHRAFRKGDIIPEKDYENQKKGIIDKFSGKDRSLLKKVLKHGNQLSLEQRLTALDKELKLAGIPTIMVCSFDVVANSRNYYSHYSNDIKNTCPAEKLAELTHQCGQMLFALLLIELGIGKDTARKAIRNMRTI